MRKYLLFALIMLLSIANPTQAQEMIPLGFDEIVTAETSPIQPRFNFTFEAAGDEMVYLTLRGIDVRGDFDMRLFDAEQNLIAESRTFLDSVLIGPLVLPADGIYIVNAGRPDWSEVDGEFELYLAGTTIEPFTVDSTIMGELRNHMSIDFYTLEDIEEGDILRWRTEISDGGLIIENGLEDGAIAEYFYDNPDILIHRIAVSEPHQVAIQTATRGGTGYEITANTVPVEDIQPNETLEITLDDDNLALLSFDSPAGKTWDILSDMPEAGDGFLALLDLVGRPPWDTLLRQDYGSGANGSPRIAQFIAPEDERYYVLVNFDDYTGTPATVNVTLQSSTIFSLANGIEQTGTITPDTGDAQYQYTGTAGEQIQVSFARTSEAGAPSLLLLSPEDEVINFYGRSVDSTQFTVTLPVDGIYVFLIRDVAYSPTAMDFSLLVTPTTADE